MRRTIKIKRGSKVAAQKRHTMDNGRYCTVVCTCCYADCCCNGTSEAAYIMDPWMNGQRATTNGISNECARERRDGGDLDCLCLFLFFFVLLKTFAFVCDFVFVILRFQRCAKLWKRDVPSLYYYRREKIEKWLCVFHFRRTTAATSTPKPTN